MARKKRAGRKPKFRKERAVTALDYLRNGRLERYGFSKTKINQAAIKLSDWIEKRKGLSKKRGPDFYDEKERLEKLMENIINYYISKEKHKDLYEEFNKAVNKRVKINNNKKGKGFPQIRVSQLTKNKLNLLCEITGLESPARVIDEMLNDCETRSPTPFLKNMESRRYRKKLKILSKHNPSKVEKKGKKIK